MEEEMIKREESYILFQSKCLPVHPEVIKRYEENKSLDYELISKSLDYALEWTYRDLREHPGLIPKRKFLSPIQTANGKSTTDIEVIRDWLSGGEHFYYSLSSIGTVHKGDDENSFPFRGLHLRDSGIHVGMKPIILTYDSGMLFKNTLKHFGVDSFLSEQILKEYGIVECDVGYKIPALWYTKDAEPLVKLFGKNFAINYNNEVARKKCL